MTREAVKNILPLLDTVQPHQIKVGPFSIGQESPVFVIAEIGLNHNGSIERAKELVDKALWAGADCVKFQLRDMQQLYVNADISNAASEDLGAQYTLDLLSRFNLPAKKLYKVFDYCKYKGIFFLCTPWDLQSLYALEEYGVYAYKAASADLTNHELLEAIVATKKPIILSTGMSREAEIRESVALIKRYNASLILMHCNSTYPTPFKDINL